MDSTKPICKNVKGVEFVFLTNICAGIKGLQLPLCSIETGYSTRCHFEILLNEGLYSNEVMQHLSSAAKR